MGRWRHIEVEYSTDGRGGTEDDGGMVESYVPRDMTRLWRRGQVERVKRRRRDYWGRNETREQAKNPLYRYGFDEEEEARMDGILAKTPQPCSCWMCGNRRKRCGPTRQERLGALNTDEQLIETGVA